MSNDRLADSEWIAFMARLETAEHEFAQGRPELAIRRWCWSNLPRDPDRHERSTKDLSQTGLIEGEDPSFRGED